MNPYIQHLDSDINVWYIENLNCQFHFHSHVELFFVISGNITATIGGKIIKMKAGDMAFISPMQIHSYSTDSDERNASVAHIFAPQYMPDFYIELSKMQPAEPVLFNAIEDECIDFSYNKLMRMDWGEEALKKALLHMIVASCFKRIKFIPVSEHGADNLYKVIAYINEHFAEDISFDDLGIALGISKFSLSRTFSNKIGIGFREYVNSLRFEKMKALFSSTQLTITEICYECGFSNQRTFNRACIRQFGKTPKEIRIQLRKQMQ